MKTSNKSDSLQPPSQPKPRDEKQARRNMMVLFWLAILSYFAIGFLSQFIFHLDVQAGAIQQIQATQQIGISSIGRLMIYIGEILLFTGIILVLVRRKKQNFLKYLLMGFSIFTVGLSVFLLASIFLNSWILAIGLTAIAVGLYWRYSFKLGNLFTFIACVVLAAIGGILLGLWFSFILLAVLAIYDLYAVFVSKHMLTLAKTLMESKLRIPAFFAVGKEGQQNMLGGGDISIAGFVIAGTAGSPKLQAFTVGGAMLGMMLNVLVIRKLKRPLPALPLLWLGLAIGLGLGMLL